MKAEKIDMSPEAVTNRLKMMEQLWELSINLMNAKPIENKSLTVNSVDAKTLGKESDLLKNNNLTQF